MAKITVIDLENELRKGMLRPFYVIAGEEAYLAQSAVKRIEELTLGKDRTDFSRRVCSGKEVSANELLDAIRTVPLLGGKSLIVVKDAEGLPKELFEKLSQNLDELPDFATVIFSALKVDGRSRFMQAISKHKKAAFIECKPLYSNQVPSWINIEVQRNNKRISQDAAKYLADLVGQDLGQVAQAIERIILFIGDRPAIEVKDVEEAVAETTQRTIFELTDAIGQKKMKRALSILSNLMEYGVAPVLVLNMIARHFRILLRAKEVERMGNNREIASYLGVNPFFVKNYLDQCRNFSVSELKKKFSILSQCDRELKSSRIPKDRILERLLFKLM